MMGGPCPGHGKQIMARRITATGEGTSFDLHQAGDLLRVELALFGSRQSLGLAFGGRLLDQIGP